MKNADISFRFADESDCGLILDFIRRLAEYEKMADQFTFNEETKTADPVQKMNRFILGKNFYSGGAGIYSNADDYILFADAMACGGVSVTGERILSSATIDLMRTNCLDSELMKTLMWWMTTVSDCPCLQRRALVCW